jgi:hypothetical protein
VSAAGIVLTPTTAHAAGPGDQANLSYACAQLSDAIAYLQSVPASPVRDALLARAQWASARASLHAPAPEAVRVQQRLLLG